MKNENKNIKSTNVTLKFANANKKSNLNLFINEYTRVVQLFVDAFWDIEKLPRLIPKELTDNIKSWISARAIQCAAKQASGIVRGTKKKFKQRQYIYEKLIADNKLREARKLKIKINKNPISKPIIDIVNPELDRRFIKKLDLNNSTSFDGWLTLFSLGNALEIKIPFKKTKHFNKMYSSGKLTNGIRLSKHSITFIFEIPEIKIKQEGTIEAVDVGILNTFTCSDKQSSSDDIHSWNLSKIQKKLARKKKGSVAFKKAQDHRTNYINWTINRFNLNGIKTLKLESIKWLRFKKRSSRYMSHWTYTTIFDKLKSKCNEQGVLVQQIDPAYRSQRCHRCGWTSKLNRKGKQFKCVNCKTTVDADLNASFNLKLELTLLKKSILLKYRKKKLKGFFWNTSCQECIVPDVQIENLKKN